MAVWILLVLLRLLLLPVGTARRRLLSVGSARRRLLLRLLWLFRDSPSGLIIPGHNQVQHSGSEVRRLAVLFLPALLLLVR